MNMPAHPVDILRFLDDQSVARPPVKIVDVGAMDVGESEPWARLLQSGAATLVGFEPNPAECEKLNTNARAGTR